MRRVLLALVVAVAVAGVSTGCASLPGSLGSSATPSDSASTNDYGKQAVCALGSAGVSLIRAGGAGSKALAEIIAANAQDQKIKDMANAVVNSTASDTVRNQLADWLNSYCGG